MNISEAISKQDDEEVVVEDIQNVSNEYYVSNKSKKKIYISRDMMHGLTRLYRYYNKQ